MKNFFLFIFTALLPFIIGGFGFLVSAASITIYKDSTLLFAALTLLFTTVWILSIIQWRRFSRRCKKCGKWGVLKKVQKKVVNGDSTSIAIKDKKGNPKYVEGHEYSVVTYYKCDSCGDEFSRTYKDEMIGKRY